ncbi:MAG: nucleotidyltransferase domain-containing protein [Phaeodactylibacter sp.]|nr:nucleotidyltransferase domain-containing protein [Phaeodactylibacter sp.]MCB9052142.1 nucleotidyltransferase domain-containing protein [Lewinellaceae bacterium]
MQIINDHINQIRELCLNHHVKNLYAFGSVLTDKFNESSDVDFVVEFEEIDPLEYMDNYFEVKFKLEEILNRKIDLLEAQSLENPIFKKVLNRTKALVYDRGDKELVN